MAKTMGLVLPYRKKMGQTHYLLHRELIPNWDQQSDICGLVVEGTPESLETKLVELLNKQYGLAVEANAIRSLGVCASGRDSEDTYYLYGVDVTKVKGVELITAEEAPPADGASADSLFWADAELLLESVDAQLIACYAKVGHLLV